MKHLSLISVFLSLFIACMSCSAMAQSATDQAAERFWNAMLSHTDAGLLDEFIEKYPNSDTAKYAFLMRYVLLTQNPTIEDYNAFLKKYPEKFQSQMALQEVFDLYQEHDHVAYWADFLQRYPDTQQGLVAKLHLQTLMAEFAVLCDDEETFDAFIFMFPDAPQIPAMMELAQKKAVANEEVVFAASTHEQRERRANAILFDWEDWNLKSRKIFPDSKASIVENGEAFLLAARILRYEKVIALYKEYSPSGRLAVEKRHQELLAKLDSIQQTLIDNHRELVKTIREESALTRKTIQEEFTKLGLKFDAGFEKLGQKMDALHNDLFTVYQELQKVNSNLENIQAELQKSNQYLARIDQRLDDIHNTMAEGFAATVGGLANLGDKLDNLTDELVDFKLQTTVRMDRNYELQVEQYNLQVKQYEKQLEQLDVSKATYDVASKNLAVSIASNELLQSIDQKQDVLINNSNQLIDINNEQLSALGDIQRNQVLQMNAINNVADEVRKVGGDVRNMNRDLNKFRNETQRNFAITNRNMKAGFNDMKRSVYDVGNKVIQSNQQTFERMQQLQQQAAAQSSSSGGLIGKIGGLITKALPIAGAAVGTALGGPVGTAIGGAMGSALSTAVGGGSGREIVGSAINSGINSGLGYMNNQLPTAIPGWQPSYYPNSQIPMPSHQQIFDNIVGQGTNALKSEIERQVRDNMPVGTDKLINSMLQVNFEQRKAKAIKAVASLFPGGVPQNIVQGLQSARNEQELRNTVTRIANANSLNPSAILYAMDYIF